MLGSVVQVHLSPPTSSVLSIRYLSRGIITALLLTAWFCGSGTAIAQLRAIPDEATRGQLRYVGQTIVELDGVRAQLSPGAQIRTPDNRILVPNALPQDTLLVKYLVDAAGMVHRVWILTQDEAAKPDKKQR